MKKLYILVLVVILPMSVDAQCAMCRATLENNLTNGQLTIGSTLNTGIMYLFFAPYLALGLIAVFWYLHSRKKTHA